MEPEEIFLRGAWKCVPDDSDSDWVNQIADQEWADEPLGDFGPIIREMLDKGVAASKIARFAKIIGYESIFSLCYHLSDPITSHKESSEEIDEVAWGLYQVNPELDEPIRPMLGLHESMLSMDPSGREMRPTKE